MNLIFEEITYKIIGALYATYNELGYGHREKAYQQALAEELKATKLSFKRELYFPVSFRGKVVSRYFLDFLVDKRIVLEIKVANDFYQSDINQILAYLKVKNYHLGILAIFTEGGVKIKRLVN